MQDEQRGLISLLNMMIRDEKKYKDYLIFSSKCILKSEVSGSILNWLWWFLDPLFYMLVYAFLSVIIFKAKQRYYPIYIIIGVITWNLFNKQIVSSVNVIKNNMSILSKCYIPKFIFLLQNLFVNTFKFIISFFLVFVMMAFWRVPISFNILYLIPYTFLLITIAFALSIYVMHVGVYIRDTVNIVTVIMRIVFYLSGIFYSIKANVPYPFNEIISCLNPVYVVIDGIRETVLYGNHPNLISLIAWLLVSIVLIIFGVALVYKYENDYIKVTQ